MFFTSYGVYVFMLLLANAKEGSYLSCYREDATFEFTTQLSSFPA